MNDHLTHLKKDPNYSLSDSERALMRMRLEELTRQMPMRAPSGWFVLVMRPMPLAALAMILIVSTTSVSFAAGGSLPGDVLYPIKLGVNEKVELAFAPGNEAKANVHVRQAEERLRETEVLAVRGDLNTEVAEQAIERVTKNIEGATGEAEELAEEGDAAAARGIRTRIAAALDAHSELLDAQAENFSDEPRAALRALSVAVKNAGGGRDVAAAAHTDDDSMRVAAEAAEARAKERVRAFAAYLKENGVPDETESELLNEYDRLSTDLAASEGFLEMSDYWNANQAYDDIDKRAYRALTLLRSAQKIADKTDKEVVITLDTGMEAATLADEAPVALQAKTSDESEAATMMFSLEAATTSNEAQEEAPTLEFRVRDALRND